MSIKAWPAGNGEFYIGGSGTFASKEKIMAAGGRWDAARKRWFVTRDQAKSLKVPIMVHVRRALVCCEESQDGISTLGAATEDDVAAGKMRVRFCIFCDSHIDATADIIGLAEEQAPCP